MSLLVTFEILGLLVNTLTSYDKYSLRNSKNLPQPIQMQLSRKLKIFLDFLNFKHFAEKGDPYKLCISESRDYQRRVS